jgi:hypothetical protein
LRRLADIIATGGSVTEQTEQRRQAITLMRSALELLDRADETMAAIYLQQALDVVERADEARR